MDATREASAGAEATPVHPYYTLLPSYVTPESIQAERHDFLRRIQETLDCLQTLCNEDAQDGSLQNRHFRDVDTFYKLKHELPVELHAQLIRALVELLWTRDGRAFTDVDMEIRAVKALQLLLKKWKKHHRGDDSVVDDLVVDWRAVRRAIERVCFRAPGCIQQASQSYLAKLTNTTVKCAEEARSFFRASDPAVPLVLELWTEFGATVKNVKTTECFRALALFSFLLSLQGSEDTTAVVDLLPEWFSAWSLISRCNEWDGHWMKILSRVTKRYPSTSMLDDYLPFVFAKVNDLLELPSDLGSPFKKQVWPSAYNSINGSKRFGQHAMRLCVYLLRDGEDDGGDADPTRFLLEILSLMKSFFHPSNVANVGNSLATYLYYLSNVLGKRLGHEKAGDKSALDDGIDIDDSTSGRNEEANSTPLHARETAMQWLACCEKYGDGKDMLAVLHDLLPVALLSQSHPKAEVAVQAKNVTDAVSLSLRMYFVPQDASGEEAVTRLLELLKRLSTSRTWKTRGAVLRFTMTLAFYHWVFFPSNLKEQVHAFICAFLTDEQREVQAMAKYALRGLLHNEQPAAVEAMSVRLTESAGQARVKFPKLKRRCERLEAEGATQEELQKAQERLKALEAKMMESVLSLSAVILAFPHDVPSFVPPIFEELGRFLYMKRSSNTISFLEKAVKETLLDFKRTHQDNWLETKTKFTPAQLDVIEDVAIAPSYFS
ncbi:Proteasome activator complex subunit 4 [Phytophthora cinnamomi]|uniref:Proteasome activator complex subunit 4 n=1 Tax=Phytophthora cinnamomi TaxID=4785 RepID=UPI00355A45FF|nr:Proteasome activator complex subunit 4 [Phytophthora cinnamomi]